MIEKIAQSTVLPPAVVLSVDEPALVPRNERGQFVAGSGPGGAPRGSLGRTTAAMKRIFAQMAGDDPRNNPLCVLMTMMRDESLHPSLRANCADKLAKFLFPHLQAVNIGVELPEVDGNFEAELTRVRVALRTSIGLSPEGKTQ